MEFSSEAGRFILSPNSEGNSSVRTCTQTHSCCIPAQKRALRVKRRLTKTLHKNACIFAIYMHVFSLSRLFSLLFLFCSFTALSCTHCLPLMLHSEHEHSESASLDTAAEYSALRCLLFFPFSHHLCPLTP